MTGERIAGIAVFAVVIGGIALGFAAIGPPQHVRLAELDRRRMYDLQDIESRLHLESNQRPSDAGAAVPDRPADAWPRDPVTRRPYEYHRETAGRYRLCATFALPSDDEESRWRHGAGRTCYRLSSARADQPERAFSTTIRTTTTTPR
ncbi:MAG TPA: hypothetical protein VGC72_08975 [Candidatus Elarobacter sp.]